jgi:hypothetical protein
MSGPGTELSSRNTQKEEKTCCTARKYREKCLTFNRAASTLFSSYRLTVYWFSKSMIIQQYLGGEFYERNAYQQRVWREKPRNSSIKRSIAKKADSALIATVAWSDQNLHSAIFSRLQLSHYARALPMNIASMRQTQRS